ncbi:signal peptidase II [Holospora curviuscula]|uniref:Lipoprotein signal peptidase n=1 Tax=Holospora curviuscula TaxID=1082868 RepID=A0A2S5R8Y9_9PROT|nr:signal peptidase II [Holospora curviuscula]PPE03788.1 Lipoprotein signal peptidase [Holospora curviuscula]
MHNIIFRKYLWLFGVVLVGVTGDQATKSYVKELLSTTKRIRLCTVFSIVSTYNTGISWGLFSKTGSMLRWGFVGLSMTLVGMFLYMFYNEKRPSTQWAIALIIAGAFGNILDRVWLGAVFDFLSVHWKNFYFPVFNLADMLISVGFMILLRDYYKWNY